MTALQTPPIDYSMNAIDFILRDVSGKMVALNDFKNKGLNGLVVAFICNHCPYVLAIIDKIVKDADELQKKNIGFVAIMPNDYDSYPQDSFDNMIIMSKEKKFCFPYLLDDTQEIARSYGAVCTPDFFGFDKDFHLIYRGRLDDSGMKINNSSTRDLFNAMLTLVDGGRPNAKAQFPSIGCSIKWRV
ncbi:Thioredoxin family protein [Candidatus Xenohaliotis californiensis]|uniref:Thioredoxin family protein n=1 Tax=Candidatus Xenohaliotis californiensis TaxID=84677 RepID=A0ABM9N953_9RICK|nr:Thioredoxin family protein [Candidatus Xenohaliotis californiensis]